MTVKICVRMSLTVSIFFLASVPISQAQYSGGSGTAEDPYQIATAADLIAPGETPDDYDKHLVLTADIDMSGFDGSESKPGFTLIGTKKEGLSREASMDTVDV